MESSDLAARRWLDGRIELVIGDITAEHVDAIVNAANASLLGGGGVDGAIHRAGGPEILAECRRIRADRHPDGLPTGSAVATTAGRLAARYVIHTVGPVHGAHAGAEADLLADCYRNTIALAAALGCTSIAFPAISTGAYGYPRERAAVVASVAIAAALAGHPGVERVRLVFRDAADAGLFAAHQRFPADGPRCAR
jgi:O-acetyl-ADP-ribose deacetylase (regulator of RNase III)